MIAPARPVSRRWRRWARAAPLCAALALGVAACGSAGSPTPSSGYVLMIQGDTFSPPHLAVPAGTTVVVLNRDDHPHTVTSASAPGTYSPGSVAGVAFDTGAMAAGASGQFTIPAGAPAGTVVPYFDRIMQGAMLNQGDVTVTAAP